jgi:hypothetical protein
MTPEYYVHLISTYTHDYITQKDDMYIYFAQDVNHPTSYKFGMTSKPAQRLANNYISTKQKNVKIIVLATLKVPSLIAHYIEQSLLIIAEGLSEHERRGEWIELSEEATRGFLLWFKTFQFKTMFPRGVIK